MDQQATYIAAVIRSEPSWRGKPLRYLLRDGFFQHLIVAGRWTPEAMREAVAQVAKETA